MHKLHLPLPTHFPAKVGLEVTAHKMVSSSPSASSGQAKVEKYLKLERTFFIANFTASNIYN